MTGAEDDDTWRVLVNAQGQFALSKLGHPEAPGWSDAGVRGRRSACLEEVSRRWSSLAPPQRPQAKAEGPAQLDTPAFILWFTGLSGAGKSTLSKALRDHLARVRPAEILDGDEVRAQLSAGLGFSKDDRDVNIRRIGFVARLLARHGVVAITAAISPYAAVRDEIRALAALERVPFIEVWARADLDVLVKRDTKGLYKKAMAGELKQFTGISDPYEEPVEPDVTVRSDQESVEASVERIVAHLKSRRLLDAPGAVELSKRAGDKA